jgi:YD repeat-containing protein
MLSILAYDVSCASTSIALRSQNYRGVFMNCRGCGTDLAPSEEEVNTGVDQILETSLQDAEKKGGVCPLCGHSKEVPYSHRKTVLFALLLASLLVSVGVGIGIQRSHQTQRAALAEEALVRMGTNADVVRFIGKPITIEYGLQGEIKQDETGWKEAHLTIPVRGPNGIATAHVVGGRGAGPWVFTTFEIDFEKQHEKVDLVSGRVVEYDPNAYVEVHTQTASVPEYGNSVAAPPRFDGEFPCVYASVNDSGVVAPQFGNCTIPTAHGDPVDRFEADLRYGNFVLRETDLFLDDVFKVPLTRTYCSNEWIAKNPVHAFGRNSNHPYDIAPIGTRNPYTYQMIVLEDGDFLYFDRISKGTGYADAVYQHTETSTRFYKAIQSWNGNGWTTKLADGSEIRFPESYSGKNLAQGAPTEMIDAKGNHLELHRDPQRNLQEITTPHGHWIRFSYDDLSRIKRAEDDAGHWAQYEYSGDGMLKSVITSSGRERHYEYNGVLMTQITDERGRVLLHNWFQQRFLERQQFGNGAIYSYQYDWAPDEYYPRRVWVTLPDQTKRELSVGASVPEFLKNYHR